MKFTKLTKKLLLSALSLGLAVVTLTTTTFAWYTSNTDVAASGTGSTSGQSNDSSLLISNTSTGTFGPSTVFINNVEGGIVPLQFKNGEFYAYGSAEKATTGYIKFTLYFKISEAIEEDDTEIYLTNMVITNTTAKLPTYDNLSSGSGVGLPTESYSVDAVRALDMVIDNGTKKAYNLSNLMPEGEVENAYKPSTGFGSNTPDAIAYYNAVMGTTLKATDETAGFVNGTTKLAYTDVEAVATIDAGETTANATFYIYLNGWDQYCFDACRGQSFNISMAFSTEQPVAPEDGE